MSTGGLTVQCKKSRHYCRRVELESKLTTVVLLYRTRFKLSQLQLARRKEKAFSNLMQEKSGMHGPILVIRMEEWQYQCFRVGRRERDATTLDADVSWLCNLRL